MRAGASNQQEMQPRTGLWQPAQPAFWLLAVITLAALPLLGLSLIGMGADWGIWAVALIGCALQTLLLLWIAHLVSGVRGRPRRQLRSLRLGALLAGAVAAPGFAVVVNSLYGEFLGAYGLNRLSAAISAPITEDAVRMVCLILILALAATRRLTILDGVVYGFLVGAGFELMENVLYVLRGDDLGAAMQSVVVRMLMGFGLHALWTAVAGGALAYIWSRAQAGIPTRWWILIPAYVLPMLLHVGWDAPGLSVIPFLKFIEWFLLYLVTVGAFIGVVWWGRREARRIPDTVSAEAVSITP